MCHQYTWLCANAIADRVDHGELKSVETLPSLSLPASDSVTKGQRPTILNADDFFVMKASSECEYWF